MTEPFTPPLNRLRYLTYLALLITFAVVIHSVEAMIPLPMPVPGARLGLANIITLLTLTLFGLRAGLLVALLRSFLGSLITGGFLGFGFMLGAGAALASCLAMALALVPRRLGIISLLSVSVTGAAVHNLTQLALASLIVSSAALFQGYLPLLLLLAVPTGIFTGLAAHYLENTINRVFLHTLPGGDQG